MEKIKSYEQGICDLIKFQMKSYTFKTKQELKKAVKIQCNNKLRGTLLYGHIKDWDVSKVTDMSYIFFGAKEFNQPIGDWDVSNVVTKRGMSSMFSHASAFNQNISSWKIHSNIEMKGMFYKADSLNYSNLYR